METARGEKTAIRRLGRRWQFGPAVLDEPSWTLLVDGRRVPIEAKPLELLHELLLHSGEVVSKGELLDAVWPGISVVEASLPTAILKLRRALGDEKGNDRMIETVPRIGYRLAVPVDMEMADPSSAVDTQSATPTEQNSDPFPAAAFHPLVAPAAGARSSIRTAQPARHRLFLVAGLALLLTAGVITTSQLVPASPASGAHPFTRHEITNALRRLDLDKIETMLAAGWDPNTPFNVEGDGAINMVLAVCEWDPQHDKHKLLLVVRTLLDGGARLDNRNSFGDTAYSIAKAPRYCGPDHPVTIMLHTLCYAGLNPVGDKCLPTYAPTGE